MGWLLDTYQKSSCFLSYAVFSQRKRRKNMCYLYNVLQFYSLLRLTKWLSVPAVMTTALLKLNKDLTKQQDLSGSTPTHFAASADDPSLEFFLYVFMERTLEFYSLGIYFARKNWLIKLYRCLNLPLYQLVGADPSSAFQPDNDGLFPVHVAASAGNLVAVIILLTICPGCAGLRDSQGRTFLHTAVEKGRHNIVKFVRMRSQFNSILNIQDNQGNTALHLAILEGHLSIFQTLNINPHVRLNLPNHEGKTPMDLAESKAPPGFYFGMVSNSSTTTITLYFSFI